MAVVAEPFDKTVAKNCPSNGRYYFCERVGEDGQPVRFPIDKALAVQPFEWPAGARAGAWMIRYCRDSRGEEIIPHVAGRPQVVAHLQYPSEVCDRPEGASDADLLAALTKEPPIEDDEEGSLKTARIDAKKREMALDLVSKEQRVVRRGAVNKELFEGFMLNRQHRLEVRDQSEAMYRLQNQTIAMSERTLALLEKIQEGMGRVSELERSVAQRAATPPPPVDYTPVLHGVVAAIRDIGVSALQREHKPKPKTEEEATPVKAALTDKPTAPAQVNGTEPSKPAPLGAVPNTPALTAASEPPSAPSDQSSVTELMMRLARLEAERDRMASELAAERKRQEILADLAREVPAPKPPTPSQTEGPATASVARAASQESGAPERDPEDETESVRRGEPWQARKGPALADPEEDDSPVAPRQPMTATQRPRRQPTESREPTESSAHKEPGSPKERSGDDARGRSSPPADSSSLAIEPVKLPPRSPDGAQPFTPQTSRNAPCPCGSGRKYKKCCLPKDQQAAYTETAAARQRAPRETVPAQSSTDGKVAPTTASSTQSIREDAPRNASATAETKPKVAEATATPRVDPIKPAAPADTATNRNTEPPRQGPAVATRSSSPAESGSTVPKKAEVPVAPDVVPGVLGEQVQELLVNAIAGRMLANPDAPIPPPQVPRVDLVEQVIVAPSKMDPETAVKLLKDGTALETLGAFLFFNPAVRDLLRGRGK